jgi:hydroxylamine reductase
LHARCLAANIALPINLPDFAEWNSSTVEEFEAKAKEVGILSTENRTLKIEIQ